MGSLFHATFGPISCEKCGRIPRGEFTGADRRRLLVSSTAYLVPAVALLIIALLLLSRGCDVD